MHLRQAQPLADLRLRELLLVVEPHDRLVALLERLEQRVEQHAIEGALEARRRWRRSSRAVTCVRRPRSTRAAGRASRHAAPGRPRAPRSTVLDADPRALGDLRRRRGRAGRGGCRLVEPLDAHRELLELARHADRPAAVAVVALERTGDGRHRVGAERHVARGIEALDGLDERQAGDLLEVLERLGAAPVAASQAARQRQEPLDQRVAVAAAPGAPILEEQLMSACRRVSTDHFHEKRGKRIRSGPEGPDGACSAGMPARARKDARTVVSV